MARSPLELVVSITRLDGVLMERFVVVEPDDLPDGTVNAMALHIRDAIESERFGTHDHPHSDDN